MITSVDNVNKSRQSNFTFTDAYIYDSFTDLIFVTWVIITVEEGGTLRT